MGQTGWGRSWAPAERLASKAQAREVVAIATCCCRILRPGCNYTREEAAGAVVGAGVEVAAGGGDAGMSEGSLHQMNRRTAVKSMGSVCMPEPVGRNGKFNAGARCCLAYHAEYSERPQNSAVALLAGAEDRIAGLRVVTPQAAHEFPDGSRDLDSPGDSSFSEHCHLAAVGVGLQIPPESPHSSLTRMPEA